MSLQRKICPFRASRDTSSFTRRFQFVTTPHAPMSLMRKLSSHSTDDSGYEFCREALVNSRHLRAASSTLRFALSSASPFQRISSFCIA
jgi:hypothetical protein